MEGKHTLMTLHLTNGNDFCYSLPGNGRKNSLLVDTIELFSPRYAADAQILRLHDPANGLHIHESSALAKVGLPIASRPLLPEIILYQEHKQFLFFISISTMSGPISNQRKQVLEQQGLTTSIRRIYVSAFYDRTEYSSMADQIAWHSYVWLAHAPDHVVVHW